MYQGTLKNLLNRSPNMATTVTGSRKHVNTRIARQARMMCFGLWKYSKLPSNIRLDVVVVPLVLNEKGLVLENQPFLMPEPAEKPSLSAKWFDIE